MYLRDARIGQRLRNSDGQEVRLVARGGADGRATVDRIGADGRVLDRVTETFSLNDWEPVVLHIDEFFRRVAELGYRWFLTASMAVRTYPDGVGGGPCLCPIEALYVATFGAPSGDRREWKLTDMYRELGLHWEDAELVIEAADPDYESEEAEDMRDRMVRELGVEA